QFEISTDNGATWIPQCGNFTSEGTNIQPAGEPLYDGTQSGFVLEEISLSDYLGEEILARFQLVTDDQVTRDGFYFDDLEFLVVNVDSCPTTTTYTVGGGWSNGMPTDSVKAIVNGNYNTSITGNITACTLVVNSEMILTVASGNFVSVLNDITIDGTLIVSHEGSVVQVNEDAKTFNNGNISVEKITPTIDDRNYVSMSSPMDGETRDGVYGNSRAVFSVIPANFVPFNIDLMTFPEFAGAEVFLDDNLDYVSPVTGSTPLPVAGIGQLVFPQPAPNVGDGAYTLTYTQGTLHSGTISVPVNYNGPATTNNYNLLGNPYASAIDVTAFINANDAVSAVYYWDHITNPTSALPGPGSSNFSMNDISVRNAMMGIGAVNGSTMPTQFMASGQGFAIKAEQTEAVSNTPVVFTNSLRVTGNNDDFRSNEAVSNSSFDKLWLHITTSSYSDIKSQMAIGFMREETEGLDLTSGFDAGYDTTRLGTFISLFSTLETGEQLSIQGRETFNAQMEIPVGFSTSIETEETYTINIDHFEGAVLEGASIFLIDNVLNTITNLKEETYTFIATKGIQPDRFIVVFEEREVLDIEDEVLNENEITVFPNPASNEITLDYSGNRQLQEAIIININGQKIQRLDLSDFNQSQRFTINPISTGIYFIQIVSKEKTILKKLIVK
ncbi:T9SS type A sorting domain-containing protein, partial [Dokdonia sp.]|uniref:T9SS type A sorting domain-containing protein n=1 Tax=Dokdonia sp. TaxID=2024995 RepID=UPI003265496E